MFDTFLAAHTLRWRSVQTALSVYRRPRCALWTHAIVSWILVCTYFWSATHRVNMSILAARQNAFGISQIAQKR